LRGNIRQRAKNSWTITIELPKDEITNKRKQKYYTVKGNKREAEKFLTEKLRELDTGLLIDTKKMKLGEYFDYWLKEYCYNNLTINTIEGYEQYIEKHIKPILGNIELEKLKPLQLQTFYSEKLEKGKLSGKGGLSKQTVRSLHRIIHGALAQAVKWQLLSRNVADCVEPPKPQKYEAKFLNDEQTNLLIEKAKKSDIYIPVIIAIFTGMRRGEVLGLNWQNVNFEKKYIRVVQELSCTKQGLKILPPKTKKSIRNIAIPDTLIKILKNHKAKQNENRLLLGQEYQNIDMVCTYPNGKLFYPKRFSAKFHELLSKNDLPIIRFHDLRHSHASLLVKLGVQPKIISERLGHSNIGITMDLYSHLYEEADREVADAFEELIKAK
jgi:integrase